MQVQKCQFPGGHKHVFSLLLAWNPTFTNPRANPFRSYLHSNLLSSPVLTRERIDTTR